MAEKRGLGRGLSALLGEVEEAGTALGAQAGLRDVPIELIHRHESQPRWRFNDAELEELAASLREKGVLQPVLLRPRPGLPGHFELVAGERRWRAAQKVGLHVLPALVRDLDDAEMLEIAVIENVQREALNPLEEANAYNQLVETHGRTHAQVADVVGKSRAHVTNSVRLLNLPASIQSHVLDGRLTAGHARALLSAADPDALADLVIRRQLSVRATEALARKASAQPPAAPRKPAAPVSRDPDTLALESDLSDVLGLEVQVLDRQGQGELRIRYATLEQLDEVCRRLTRS